MDGYGDVGFVVHRHMYETLEFGALRPHDS